MREKVNKTDNPGFVVEPRHIHGNNPFDLIILFSLFRWNFLPNFLFNYKEEVLKRPMMHATDKQQICVRT